MTDPVNVFWCLIGVFFVPEIVLAYILWQLDHAGLAIFALIMCFIRSHD